MTVTNHVLGTALVMFVDMFLRLRRQVGRAELGTEGGVRAEKKRA